jgi:hypothetical protein
MGVPFEVQDDDAEDVLKFPDRIVLLTKRSMKRPMVVVAIMVAITLVLASVLLSIMGQSPYYEDNVLPRTVVRVQDLPDFENTHTYELMVNEQQEQHDLFDFYHPLRFPQETNEIVICLIDTVTVTITWMDEPDESGAVVSYENQPDTVRASVSDSDHVFFVEEEGSNPHGGWGTIVLSWEGDGVYLERSLRRVDDTTWAHVAGQDYVTVKGGEVHWGDLMRSYLLMVEAGDQTHDVLPLGVQDTGNLITFQITLAGRFISLKPGTYSDRSDR